MARPYAVIARELEVVTKSEARSKQWVGKIAM